MAKEESKTNIIISLDIECPTLTDGHILDACSIQGKRGLGTGPLTFRGDRGRRAPETGRTRTCNQYNTLATTAKSQKIIMPS